MKEVTQDFIEKVFKEIIEDMDADENIISQYFSIHYIQHVDGHILNYRDFVNHMAAQKALLKSVKISIERCLIEKNKICTVHRVNAIKKNGELIAVKVIAYFEIENDKIILCDELTHLLKGEEEDLNIGSVK